MDQPLRYIALLTHAGFIMTSLLEGMFGLAEATLQISGAFRFIHRHVLPGCAPVLMYHGLTEKSLPIPDPCILHVQTFRRQMEHLARHFDVVHVDEAADVLGRRTGRPLACVTFDDGFASVAHLAAPILECYRVPATVYLVTDLIDTQETVWSARLHQAICETSESEVTCCGQRFPLCGPAARATALAGMQRALKRLLRNEFEVELQQVLVRLDSPRRTTRAPWEPFQMMSLQQVRAVGRSGLIRFGAHTASHQILTRTTPDDAQREINLSISAVAELVDHPSQSFAYPNGGPGDFDGAIVGMLRKAGIRFAVSTISGHWRQGADHFAIPRYCVHDTSLARFSRVVHLPARS